MKSIQSIFILYNPNSTGPAEQNALDLKKLLAEKTQISCTLLETKREHHATELAKKHAEPGIMIISSSGDGGFHELINGVLQSKAPKQTVVGLLPSGNANDHHTARHTGELLPRIVKGEVTDMDVLEISWNDQVQYAHSYAGLGITAEIGKALTEKRPSALLEPWLVIIGLIKRHPVRIIINGRKRRYDSFVINVIGKMSKYLATGEKNRPKDGTFDLMIHRHTSLNGLFRHLIKHVIQDDIKDATTRRSLAFTTTHKTSIQLDGEVYVIGPSTKVTVTCLSDALRCII